MELLMCLPCGTEISEWQFQELKPQKKIAYPCFAFLLLPVTKAFKSLYCVCRACKTATYTGI